MNVLGSDNLLQRLAGEEGGARRALRELYTLYSPQLFASLQRRRVNAADAAEIVQDTFLKLWNNRLTLPVEATLGAYVWCIARNRWIDGYRAQRTRDDGARSLKAEMDTLETTPTTDDGIECLERAFEYFQQREPERAHAIELVAVEGFDHTQLADALGRSRGAAREFLSQARRAFSSLYEQHCGEGAI
jgi:RNA polymerase sigma-70 factor (ECF subfamily)